MSSVQIEWPGGSGSAEAQPGSAVWEVLKAAGAPSGMAGARVDDRLRGLMEPVGEAARVVAFGVNSPDGLYLLRHSTAHIMATAIQELFPGTKFAIGPPIDDGFYYDMEAPRPFTPEDLAAIEAKMREIIKANQPFERVEVNRLMAINRFKEAGDKYKVEILEGLPDEVVTYYINGPFTDLCRGPHVPRTGVLNSRVMGPVGHVPSAPQRARASRNGP